MQRRNSSKFLRGPGAAGDLFLLGGIAVIGYLFYQNMTANTSGTEVIATPQLNASGLGSSSGWLIVAVAAATLLLVMGPEK